MNSRDRTHPSSALPLTHVAFHVLVALSTKNRHGYGILRHVSERTDGRVELEAGSLYAAIKRMREEGWIVELTSRPGESSRRRTYSITKLGREILEAESRRLESMVRLAQEARVLPRPGQG
ncbi:MAG: helix-turn-helix transcriptional regulator [Holophagales bacterium]|nr:helix-turn-helix transcriptional regulator [Holophagales bacterium]